MERGQPEKARLKAEAFSSDVTFIIVTVAKSRGFRGFSLGSPILSRLSMPVVHGSMWTGSMAGWKNWHRSHTSLRLPTSEVVDAAAPWLCYGPPWRSQSSFLMLVLAFTVRYRWRFNPIIFVRSSRGQQISRDGRRDGKSFNIRGGPHTVWIRHLLSSFSQTLPCRHYIGQKR